MTMHSFDIELAKKVGVNAAIIYNNLCFWIEKNRANNKNFIDGYFWTYNSWDAWCELFPYMGKYEIKAALTKLKDENLIHWEAGLNQENKWDKTTYYRLVEDSNTDMRKNHTSVCEKTKHHLMDTDINTDINTDSKHKKTIQKKEIEIENQIDFDLFWSAYPNKKSKPLAFKAFQKALKGTNIEILLRAIEMHKRTQQWTKNNGQFIPMPATWLNQERWKDELSINDIDDNTFIEYALRDKHAK